MRKTTVLFNMGILLLTTVIILIPEIVVAQPDLVIEDFKGGLHASAVIKNEGETNATNIQWNMHIFDDHIFFTSNNSGVIPVLQPGSSMVIKTGPAIGFGKIFINATATCAEGDNITVSGRGFLLLFFMLGVSQEPTP